MFPRWGLALKQVIPDDYRWVVLRLSEYDPVKAAHIEERCTLTEIAEAAIIRLHDNSAKPIKQD